MQTIEQRAVVFSLPLQSQSKSNFYLAAARLAPLNYRSSKRTPVLLICKQMKKGHKYIYIYAYKNTPLRFQSTPASLWMAHAWVESRVIFFRCKRKVGVSDNFTTSTSARFCS